MTRTGKRVMFGFISSVLLVAGLVGWLTSWRSGLTDQDFILNDSEDTGWHVTSAQASDAKAALIAFLAADDTSSEATRGHANYPGIMPYDTFRPVISEELAGYLLQFIGWRYSADGNWGSGSGEDGVWINGACKNGVTDYLGAGMTPSRNLLTANDGGHCFFQAGYSLSQRAIIFFRVNGQEPPPPPRKPRR